MPLGADQYSGPPASPNEGMVRLKGMELGSPS